MALAVARPAKRPPRVRKTSQRLAKLAGRISGMSMNERKAYFAQYPDAAAKAFGSLAASVLSQVK